MGTKIQLKSYIPLHNVMRNKNEHSSSNWSWYCQDNVLSGHLYDGTLLREANSYSLCDKEMLKQTMLEHEATFTKQVFELHRLYRIQKELMNELKNRERVKLCSTFQANLFASHILSGASEELRQMPYFCALNGHTATVNAMELPLKHVKESATRYFQMPVETAGSSIEGHMLRPKSINLPRKKFDLHLPAEAYMDIDDKVIAEKQKKPRLLSASPSSITHNVDGDNDVKLSPMSKDDGSINGSSMLCMHDENASSRIMLTDLNEPLKPLSYEEGEVSTFSQVIGSTMEHEEIMRHQLHSNKSSSSKDFLIGNLCPKQTTSTFVNMDKVECLQGRRSSTSPSGEIRSNINGCHGELCYGEFSAISHIDKDKSNNWDEPVSAGQIKTDKWIGETLSLDTEITGGRPNLNNSQLASSQMPPPFATFSLSDNSSIPSQSIVSRKNSNNVKQIPTLIQLLPGFNGYAVNNCRKADETFQIPCNPFDDVQYVDGSLKLRVKVDLSLCQNEFYQDLKQDGISPRQKCLPLIINKKSSNTSCLDNVTFGSCNVLHDPKCCSEGLLCVGEKQSLEPSWLRKKQAQSDPAGVEQSASHLMNLMSIPNSLASSMNEQNNNKNEIISMCSSFDSSSLHVMGRDEASCIQISKRILEFPIHDSTERGVDRELSSVAIRNKVNMHSSASCINALNSLVILPKDELPSSLSTENISTKMTPMIDLKGLMDTEIEKHIITAEEKSKELRCNSTTDNIEVGLQLANASHDALIRGAVDNLVAISLFMGNHYHDLIRPSITNSFDTLHWFADFVTSTEVNSGIPREKSPQHDDVDGFDMFEYMTMKLKEITEDEFFYKPQENQNYDDDTSTALLPMTGSQRGLERKRRQRRDFQKDILPGLASLSRHEISEDLQSFGGIMRASGKSWKTGLSRRSTSQKFSNLQARGRQRQRLKITVTEVKIGSSQKKIANSKHDISATGILSWGRTTRRCRRPRLLPGNLSVSIT